MMETMAMQIWMPMKPETEPEKTDDDMQERKKPVKNEPETETEDDMPTLIPVEPALIPVEPAAPRGRTLKCKQNKQNLHAKFVRLQHNRNDPRTCEMHKESLT